MLLNQLTITIRHLLRQPAYTFLNIFGLTLGIVSSLLIVLYLFKELSYDRQHKKGERIYRVSSDISEPDNSFRWAVTQLPLGRTLKSEFSEVEQYVRFIRNGRTRFGIEEKNYFEEDIYMVDSTVFEVFDFELIAGNPEKALSGPSSIVISETMAGKIFGKENPIGKILKTDRSSLEVTGVFRDVPKNSHIRPNAMISASTSDRNNSQNWGGFGIFTYVLLQEGTDYKALETKLNEETIKKYVAVIFDQFDIKIKYEMINIRDIHLHSTFDGEPETLGEIKYIYIFAAVALFLVLIAAINYMNLSTARSVKRSKEVGIRKVLGAYRGALIQQFLTESVLLTLFSAILGVLALLILVPFLNDTLQTSLLLTNLLHPEMILAFLGILIFTALLSGSYPAFFLSSFKPAAVLKGKGGKGGNRFIRSTLVTIQFSISIFMLVGTLVIYDQMQYLQSKDLGFDKDQVVKFNLDNDQLRAKWPVLRTRLLENSAISSASTSTTSPGDGFGKNLMGVERNDGTMEEYGIDSYGIDYDFLPTLGIEIVNGRNISSIYPTDTSLAVLVNEAMVVRMGWDNPIGKRFQFDEDSTIFRKVVGVVKDYHQLSLYNPIEALLLIPSLNNGTALVKINGDASQAVKHIEASWNELFPNRPFEYSYLDEDFMQQYEADQLRGKLFLGFSGMMIVIACLGLIGLASFTAEQRTKEISIRKVLGANVSGLVLLLIRHFLILMVIGAIPAFALAYYMMGEWLASFQYHVDINLILFVVVLAVVLLLTVVTTGYQALKTARANPADNLKYE